MRRWETTPTKDLPHRRLTRFRRRVFWGAVAAYAVGLPLIIGFAFGLQVEPDASDPIIETATLEVSTVPPGARVSVGGSRSARSPAVFDGLRAGELPVAVEAKGAVPWRGSVRVDAGLAYTIAELRMVPRDALEHVGELAAGPDPILLRGGRSMAWVAGDSIVMATLSGGSIDAARITLPVAGGPILRPDVGDELTAGVGEGDVFVVDLGLLSAIGLARPSLHAVRLPSTAVAILSMTPAEIAVDYADAHGIRRRWPDGTEDALLDLEGGLAACGRTHGGWYLLDGAGVLYHYSRLLPSARIGGFDMTGCEVSGRGECMVVLLAAEEAVVCFSPELESLYVLRRDRAAETYQGMTGGAAAEERTQAWLWRGRELFTVGPEGRLRLVASFDGEVERVQEEFAPHHVAVQTGAGIYLLPTSAATDEWMKLDPLLLVPSQAATSTTVGRDGFVMVRPRQGGKTAVYHARWSEP